MIRPGPWLVRGETDEPLPPDTPVNRLLVPVNNGRPRLQKTPLGYWCMAAAGLLVGHREVDEFTARLPAAVAAVLCTWLVLALGRRMFAPRAALLAALIFASSLGCQKWARSARPEMILTLAMTAAMACFYVGLTAASRLRRAGWMMLFWLAMALANLAKPVFPLLVLLPLTVYLCWREGLGRQKRHEQPAGGSRRLLAKYWIATAAAIALGIMVTASGAAARLVPASGQTAANIVIMVALLCAPLAWYAARTRGMRGLVGLLPTAGAGGVLVLAALVPWMWYMQKLFGGAGSIFGEQVSQRAAGTGKWSAAEPHFYVMPLLTLTLPWIGLLPGAMAAAWLQRFARSRSQLLYLFLWSVGLIALLTLAAGKRDHYLLPALPAMCLLMGFVADDVFFRHRWISARLGRALALAYGAAFVLGPVGVAVGWLAAVEGVGRLGPLAEQPSRWVHMLVVAAIAAAPAGVGLVMALRRRLRYVPATILASILILYAGHYLFADLWDLRVEASVFPRRAAAIIGPEEPVASWADPQFKTVYYFRRNIPSVFWTRERLIRRYGEQDGEDRWTQWMQDPRNVAWMFCYGQYVEQIRPLGFEVVLQVQGKQEKQILFTLLRNVRLRRRG